MFVECMQQQQNWTWWLNSDSIRKNCFEIRFKIRFFFELLLAGKETTKDFHKASTLITIGNRLRPLRGENGCDICTNRTHFEVMSTVVVCENSDRLKINWTNSRHCTFFWLFVCECVQISEFGVTKDQLSSISRRVFVLLPQYMYVGDIVLVRERKFHFN